LNQAHTSASYLLSLPRVHHCSVLLPLPAAAATATTCCRCTLQPPVSAPRACRTRAPRRLYDRALRAAAPHYRCHLPLAAMGCSRARAYGALKCAAASSRYTAPTPSHTTARPQFISPLSQKKLWLLSCHCHRAQSSAAPSLRHTRAAT
jgi:hypothetical protein